MLKTIILIAAFFAILIITGVITRKSIVNQHKEEKSQMGEKQFNHTIGSSYSYKNSNIEKVVTINGKKEITVKLWSFSVLGDLYVRLFDSDGKVYLEWEGKNMDDSTSFTLNKGSYLLGVKYNHAFLGSYVLGFRNIDGLSSPVVMDSLGRAKRNPRENGNLYLSR